MGMAISLGTHTYTAPDRVFLDACVIIDYYAPSGRHHLGAVSVVGQLVTGAKAGDVSLYVSPLVLDEVWYNLTRLLYESDRGPNDPSWGNLGKSGKRSVFLQFATDLRQMTAHLLSAPQCINLVNVSGNDVRPSLARLTHGTHNLEPRDALHLAVMQRLSITGIATNDGDFSNVGVTRIPFAP